MNKLGNKRTYVYEEYGQFKISNTKEPNSIHFHSMDEAEYYIFLREKGFILGEDFTMQNKYELVPKFSYMGKKQRGVVYIDDFRAWDYIIDIKGMETDHYKIKAQMMKQKCAKESTADKPIYYLALYDLLNHLKYAYDCMPKGIRYMDIQMVKDLKKETAKVEKGKGVNERRRLKAKEFIDRMYKSDGVVTNQSLSCMYYQ